MNIFSKRNFSWNFIFSADFQWGSFDQFSIKKNFTNDQISKANVLISFPFFSNCCSLNCEHTIIRIFKCEKNSGAGKKRKKKMYSWLRRQDKREKNSQENVKILFSIFFASLKRMLAEKKQTKGERLLPIFLNFI